MNEFMNESILDYEDEESGEYFEDSGEPRRVHFSSILRDCTSSPTDREQPTRSVVSQESVQVRRIQRPQYRQAERHDVLAPQELDIGEDQRREEGFQGEEEEYGQVDEFAEEVDENTSAIFTDEASYDVESLTERLNDISNYLRKEVMSQFYDVKGRLHKKTQEQLRKIIHDKEAIIADKEQRIEKLVESIKKRDYYLNKFKGLTFRMADLIAHVREQEYLKTMRAVCFIKWREYIQEKKRQSTLTIVARRHYLRRVKRRILQGWYIWILQTKQSSSDAIWQLRLDTSVAEVKNDYEIKMEQMRQQIEVLNSRLLHETKDKRILQDNLKKALMRGVCAMNNQFLDIIKGTTETSPLIPNMSDADLEEAMLQQLFENDQTANTTAANHELDEDHPREHIPSATSSHLQQYVREYQPPPVSQPYFPTQQSQQPPSRSVGSFSGPMEATELRTSQQRVRVTRNAARTSPSSPPRPTNRRPASATTQRRPTNTSPPTQEKEKKWRRY